MIIEPYLIGMAVIGLVLECVDLVDVAKDRLRAVRLRA
jgi:hypothetical protein